MYLSPGYFIFEVNFTRYLNGNEMSKTDTSLFVNINNSTAPPVSIIRHQKEPLGCVVYSHCPTNNSYNRCIHSCCCCLPCNYVTKPFGILQRINKESKGVYIIWTQQMSLPFPSKKLLVKFSELLLNFQV